ncbi:hypothetical protein NM208_g4215 [Fusarium decemcellulare]|uniref:Uncharacterized protein n=1 Tax=Fusarium decemcellulare TaxID=57161 RepID=A0ACC1SLG0_9HYPO|nr:hypothetical protein NM208_g4215 [Fusarium decemcellulare]
MADSNNPDLLAGIDDIDWAKLEHAYGSADDVPEIIRRLRSNDENELDNVYFALCSNILHQGSRYEATAYAVPFLYALLDAKDTPSRDRLLQYMINVAVGSTSFRVPSGVDIARWRDIVAETQQPGYVEEEERKKREYIAAATDEQDRERREGEFLFKKSPERYAAMNLYELRAYDAVREGLDSVYQCLKDEDATLRGMAAYGLAFFPEEGEKAETALFTLLKHEEDATVSATALISLAMLHAPSSGDLSQTPVARYLRTYFHKEGTDQLCNWSCAIALAILRIYETEYIEIILRKITDEAYLSSLQAEDFIKFPFAYPDLESLAASVLKVKGSEFPQAVQAAIDQIEDSKGQMTWFLVDLALSAAFDQVPQKEAPPFSQLTDLQKQAVRSLAKVERSNWNILNFIRLLDEWGIPSDRNKFDAYIEGASS